MRVSAGGTLIAHKLHIQGATNIAQRRRKRGRTLGPFRRCAKI